MIKNETNIACAECGEIVKNYQSLSKHVKYAHNMTSQEYYDIHFGPKYCEVCGKISKFANINVGYLASCSRSCSAKIFRKNLKEDEEKFSKFKDKVKHNVSEYHKNLSEEERETRLKNVSIGVKSHINSLSEEERREKYGWLNKLDNEERQLFIQKMLQTGCHKWKHTASPEELQEVRDRMTATHIKTWELRGEEIMKQRKSTFIKNLQLYQNNPEDVELSQKTINGLNNAFNI